MSGTYILDADNHVIEADLLTWGRWFERIENRRVGYTQITSAVTVSTVFLGLDHRFGDDRGPPLVFETLIMGGTLDGEMQRYSSWDDAEIGHHALVKRARKAAGQNRR